MLDDDDPVATPAFRESSCALSGGRVGPAADVYALGCVLFHMLT